MEKEAAYEMTKSFCYTGGRLSMQCLVFVSMMTGLSFDLHGQVHHHEKGHFNRTTSSCGFSQLALTIGHLFMCPSRRSV